jgi:hypothetical protein
LRIVRDTGGLSLLLGEFDLRDAPYTLFAAIHTGLFFLGFDDWEVDERPPKSVWLDSDKLKEHVDGIKQKRSQPDHQIDGPTERNALIKDLIVE